MVDSRETSGNVFAHLARFKGRGYVCDRLAEAAHVAVACLLVVVGVRLVVRVDVVANAGGFVVPGANNFN